MTAASPRRAGGAQRRFCHDQSAADAEGDRRLARREHRAFLRPDRGVLQIAPARGQGDRRRRRRPGHQGPRSGADRAVEPRGHRGRRGRSRPAAQARRPQGAPARDQIQEEGPALHPGVAPPGSAERDFVAHPQPSRAQGQPDHAAGRHHQVDDPGDPRPHPLECRESDAARPGHARALLPDRSRPRSPARRQGEAGGGRGGARLYPAARRGHHGPIACRGRCCQGRAVRGARRRRGAGEAQEDRRQARGRGRLSPRSRFAAAICLRVEIP